jgi:hypothetical protein
MNPSAMVESSSLAPARAQFAALRGRVRTGLWIEALGLVGLLLVAFAVPTLLTDRGLRLEWGFRAALLGTFVFAVGRLLVRRLFQPLATQLDDTELALAVERQSPDIRQELISSLQFEQSLAGPARGDSTAMMAAVVARVQQRIREIPFAQAIDANRVRKHLGGLLVALAFFGCWAGVDAGSLGTWAARNLLLRNVDWPRYTSLAFAEVEGGVVRLPQGDGLTVRITVTGPVPDQVFLNYQFRGGEQGTEPMSRTGEREFTLTIDTVLADAVLRAEGGDALPAELRVTVVERPRLADLQVRVQFPDYMERDAEDVPPTEGELRLPRGAKLSFAGKSQKPIDEAFLLFGDRKWPLARGADGSSFAGGFAPETSGLLTIDVIDVDKLGAGAPPKLVLRVGEDRPPTIDFRLRGIGNLIAAHARIPGDLKVKDDFGIRSIDVSMRAVLDAPADSKPADTKPDGTAATPPPVAPFVTAQASYTNELPRSALRYESPATVDLMQWNPSLDETAPQNGVRPGMLLSLRFGAKDNFGPGEPHQGYGELLTFRVVTREKLLAELQRRQVEQREELRRILDEEQTALGELREILNPNAAGDKTSAVRARLKAMARQQQTLGRRTAFVGELYQRILLEYENNRLVEPNKVRQIEAAIPQPLAAVAKESFPGTARLVDAFSSSGEEATKSDAVTGYAEIVRRLTAVLAEMKQAESLAALLEDLRSVIKIEDSVLQEVERRKQAEEQNTFGPGKSKDKNK